MRDKIEQYLAQFHEGDSSPRFHLENFARWIGEQPKQYDNNPCAFLYKGRHSCESVVCASEHGYDKELLECIPLYAEPVDQSARIAELEKQRDELLQWKHRNEFSARVGTAMQAACHDLPEGCDIHIELENGAGTVRLYLSDTGDTIDELGGDDMADKIYNAINIANAKFGAA